jgi:YVTN family beta-propeller protein
MSTMRPNESPARAHAAARSSLVTRGHATAVAVLTLLISRGARIPIAARARLRVALIGAALFAVALPAAASASSAHTAYVANGGIGNDRVTPIDTLTNTDGTPIGVGSDPSAIAISPDGATAYVANRGDGTVTPIDTATNTAGTPIGVGSDPSAIAISPDGATAYVGNAGDGTVTPIDTATNSAGTPIGVGSGPDAIAITPDGATAYVAAGDAVTPIATATNTAGTAITVGPNASAIAITPDGATAYVAGGDVVTPIATATNTAGTAIAVGPNASAIAITPDGATAYVASAGDGLIRKDVIPIDIATNTAGASILTGTNPEPLGIAITPDGTTAYVANFGDATVTPIDTATNSVETVIATTEQPRGIAITPDQAPTATFTANSATIGQPTSFDASASSASPGQSVTGYDWDFGDGTTQTSAGPTATHAYATPGNYTATLTVTDDAGCSTAKTKTFTGQTMSCNGSPVAQVTHQVTVSKASPTLATRATDAALGGTIYDIASLASGHNPGGTITFRTYGPGDATCSGRAVFKSGPVAVFGNNDLVLADFTPTAPGTYRWIASYSGDSNNKAASGACNDAGESVTVSAPSPAVSKLRLAPDSFVASSKPTGYGAPTLAPKRSTGTDIRFRLSAGALVHFSIRHVPRQRNASGPKVPHAFNRRLHAGKQSVHFTGTLDHHTLHPGNYTLYARAIDTATGYRSRKVSAAFTVLGG